MLPPSFLSPAVLRLPGLEIFVDGSNFLPAMRQAGIAHNVDLGVLARRLTKHFSGHHLVKLHYFTAASPHPHSASYRNQQRFFEALSRNAGVELVLGRLEPRGRDEFGRVRYEEKETDVNLAVRMLAGAYEARYGTALLVSGDTDFVPLVRAVQDLGKAVIWCHFATQDHSIELRHVCSGEFLFTERFLRICRAP